MLNLVSFGNLHQFSKDGKFAQCGPFTFGGKTFQKGGPIDSLERWRSSFPGLDFYGIQLRNGDPPCYNRPSDRKRGKSPAWVCLALPILRGGYQPNKEKNQDQQRNQVGKGLRNFPIGGHWSEFEAGRRGQRAFGLQGNKKSTLDFLAFDADRNAQRGSVHSFSGQR